MQLLILLFVVPTIFRLCWDYRTIEIKKQSVNYPIHTLVTGGLMVLIGIIFIYCPVATWWKAILMQFAIFFMFFDYLLNFFRNQDVFKYLGKFDDKENLSFVEEHIYLKLGWKNLLLIKVLFFIFAIAIYVWF